MVPRDPATNSPSPYLSNYRVIFQNQQFVRGLINSTIVATSTTVLALVAGSLQPLPWANCASEARNQRFT
jgi:trehalose/maltose transport system permease protein